LAIVYDTYQREAPLRLPLLGADDPARVVAWRHGEAVSAARFLAQVQAVAAILPTAAAAVNLCEDRYAFLVAFCAIALRGQANLLPSSRAPQAVDEVMAAHPGCYALGEQALDPAPRGYRQLPPLDGVSPLESAAAWPTIPAGQVVAIGYTSGSTGTPGANPKRWASFHASNAGNLARLRALAGPQFGIVATVPPQHMYGMELSILLPLIGGMAVHAGRPLFPADIALALSELPAPRVLVSTPLHLRTLVESSQPFPETALIVSATAPLDRELAAAVEARLGGQLLEMFGSTETCVIACRRTANGDAWRAHEGVQTHPRADGTLVTAPWFVEPILLQDIVEVRGNGEFIVRGRSSDMIEVAGKRASLAELTQRLLAIEGVRDAVLFQPQPDSVATIRRLAALVVAPGCNARQIRDGLAASVDPAFLPRPLKLVDALPRNELGKLPRERLLEMLGK